MSIHRLISFPREEEFCTNLTNELDLLYYALIINDGGKVISNTDLNVYISCWIDPHLNEQKQSKKYSHLANLLLNLSKISTNSLKVNLYTNSDTVIWDRVADPIFSRRNSDFKIHLITDEDLTIQEGNLFIPWLLTWQHKELLSQDVIKGNSNSAYLYLEDDAIFTSDNLEYFFEFLPILGKVGLVPGFIRAEWSDLHKSWIHPDSFSVDANRQCFEIGESEYQFMQRENPYSASILLNQELGFEYIKSDSFKQEEAWKKHSIIYDIGSTAALGLISENIPKEFINRVATPINRVNRFPIPGSVIRHQGDRYANDLWQRHFTLFGDFPGKELGNKRKPIDYFLRLLRKDFLSVLRKFIIDR
jgi:hypothetical protein